MVGSTNEWRRGHLGTAPRCRLYVRGLAFPLGESVGGSRHRASGKVVLVPELFKRFRQGFWMLRLTCLIGALKPLSTSGIE